MTTHYINQHYLSIHPLIHLLLYVNTDWIKSILTEFNWTCMVSDTRNQLYTPGRNPGGYIDRQSCFLSAVVGGRLVARV